MQNDDVLTRILDEVRDRSKPVTRAEFIEASTRYMFETARSVSPFITDYDFCIDYMGNIIVSLIAGTVSVDVPMKSYGSDT